MTAKSFEEHTLQWTGHDMAFHEKFKTTGIDFGRSCWNASRAALLSPDVAGLVKWLRSQYNRQGMIGHSTAADALESLAAQVAERDAEIARLKMENSKLRSALEIVHFKREPWQ